MKNSLLFPLVFMAILSSFLVTSQTVIPLWPKGVPNQNPSDEVEKINSGDILWIENVQNPTLEVYIPTKKTATRKAVVICPGGGYQGLAYDWEGTDIAKWYNAQGIAAFVLKYRLPVSPSLIDPKIAPLQDAQRAIRMVRHQAEKWNIDPSQVGIMGFSAGGHLASTLGTHYKKKTIPDSLDPINALNARPDFLILIYPVITFDETYYHGGSKRNLIGKNAAESTVEEFSNHLQVNAETPPTFLLHSTDDLVVPVANSLFFYQALEKNKVPVEMHIYPKGGHGYGLGIGLGHLSQWPDRLSDWIQQLN
jgi:acetyl esterase/lipase